MFDFWFRDGFRHAGRMRVAAAAGGSGWWCGGLEECGVWSWRFDSVEFGMNGNVWTSEQASLHVGSTMFMTSRRTLLELVSMPLGAVGQNVTVSTS